MKADPFEYQIELTGGGDFDCEDYNTYSEALDRADELVKTGKWTEAKIIAKTKLVTLTRSVKTRYHNK